MILNMNDLAVEVTKREGGVVNLPIAQVKEVLAKLTDIMYEDKHMKYKDLDLVSIGTMLYQNGSRRANFKKPS